MLYPLSYWGILNSAILQCTGWFVKKLEYRRRTNNRLGLRGEGMRNEVLRMLPQTVQIALTGIPDAQIEELRLRVGQKPAVLYAGGERPLSVRTVLLQKELQQTLLNASAQSQYAVQEQLRSGYLSLSGGYRLGVCGSAVVQNGCMTGLREISSLALRVPHDIRHPPERLLPYLQESCLLAGAPGSGKTTLLRSCIRALSENRQRVAVVDERLELAGAVHGVPQFDLGPCTDVLSGCPKGEGMLMLLRGMNPQWLAVDEITQPEDLAAIRQAGGCGVRLLATIHAGSVEELEIDRSAGSCFLLGSSGRCFIWIRTGRFTRKGYNMLKLIGLSLILAASGAVGAGLAGTVRRQQAQTLALIDALLRIRHELQYRLTPLPEIFAALGGSRNREIAEFFSRLAALLSSAQTCTVGYACRQALAQTRGLSLSSAARGTILNLFDSLGRYDLEGSVQALDLALSRLREEVKALQNSAAARCRTYLTLGVCTGLAAAVILI